jgi:hypothetical protein
MKNLFTGITCAELLMSKLVMLSLSKVFYKQKTSTKCVVYEKHATVRNNRAQISQNKELSRVVNWTSHITLQQTLFKSSTLANITTVITKQVK